MSQNDETRKRMVAYIQSLAAARSVSDDKIPCKIEEGLFLGSVGAANNKDALKDLNVTHILTVAKWLNPTHPNDFVYKKIDVLDTSDTNLMVHFENCFDFIDEARRAGGGVLVHCFAGRSRSVTVIIAYLMKRNGMRLSTAYALVKSKRLQISPNVGFMLQLEEFEKNLREIGSFSAHPHPLSPEAGETEIYLPPFKVGAPPASVVEWWGNALRQRSRKLNPNKLMVKNC